MGSYIATQKAVMVTASALRETGWWECFLDIYYKMAIASFALTFLGYCSELSLCVSVCVCVCVCGLSVCMCVVCLFVYATLRSSSNEGEWYDFNVTKEPDNDCMHWLLDSLQWVCAGMSTFV